jgi:hypothetical protein
MKDKFKAVLSWITVFCAIVIIAQICFVFLSKFNQPWAYALVFGVISYVTYRKI